MNLSTDQVAVAAEELAPPSQPHRLSTSCDVHPDERFSGFCPSCLCERLSVLDHNGAPAQPSSSSRKQSTISTAAALRALFKPSSGNSNNNNAANGNGRVRAGFFPELRRSKSFSAKNNEGISGGLEPQRWSCDVRLRDENRNVEAGKMEEEEEEEEGRRKSSVSEAVAEVTEEAETEEEEENGSPSESVNDSGEIIEEKRDEIVEEVKREEEVKPMKEYMDLYPHPQTKKPPSVRRSFFSAASVFSKKLQKWRHKQKIKKPQSGAEAGRPQSPVEKATRRQPRDTQSEIADYRRSSDTDPRFSLDAGRFSVDIGRISVEDSRYSLDEPRASWDGHLIGRTTLARVPPPPSMLSVVENATPMHRSDMQIPVSGESADPIIIIPGGSSQTRDYYNTEPPSRRRKSLDRSNSIKKAAMDMEEEVKSVVSNSRVVSPAESFSNKVNQNGDNKKSRRWGKWSMLGFIYRKGGVSKDGDEEDRYSRSNSTGMVERSLSESWPELRNDGGRGGGGGGVPKMRRSNSNVSWRSSGGGNKSWRRNSSSSSKDGGDNNGMLRFYLTPSWRNGGGGGGSGWEKTAARANSHGHSIARRVMRLY